MHTAPNEENEFSALDVFDFAAYIRLFPKDDQRFVSEFARNTMVRLKNICAQKKIFKHETQDLLNLVKF